MKDIFISYRRDGGDSLAQLLYTRLTMDGYSVFFDVETLRSGKFNEAIYEKIDECTDFLLILPKNSLDRCKNPEDWVRLEIEYALKKNKNIIPVMMRGFEFPEVLPESIEDIRNYNGIEANHTFFEAVMGILKEKRLLSKPVNPQISKLTDNQNHQKTNSQNEILCPVCKSKKLDADDRMMDLINISDALSTAAIRVYLYVSPFLLLFAILYVTYTSKNVTQEFLSKIDKIISYIPLLNTYVLKGENTGIQFIKLLAITFSVPLLMFIASFAYNKIKQYYYKKSIELKIYNVNYTCEDCGHKFSKEYEPDDLIRNTKEQKTNPMYLLFPLVTVLAAVILSPFALIVALAAVVFILPLCILGMALSLITKKEKITLATVREALLEAASQFVDKDFNIKKYIEEILRLPDLSREETTNNQ